MASTSSNGAQILTSLWYTHEVHLTLCFIRSLQFAIVSCDLGFTLAVQMKDYIATPKPNGYQSLHTTVIPFGTQTYFPIEIQVL